MTPLVLLLSIVGAGAVVTCIISLIIRAVQGKPSPLARGFLRVAYVLGMICAVLGVVIAFTGT